MANFRTGYQAPQPTLPEMPTPTPAPRNTGARVNKYGSRCADCGNWVEAEQGLLTEESGRWVVRHDGACPQKDLPEPNQIVDTPEPPLPVGRYTIVFADGTYKTLRVTVQDAFDNFMPGRTILSYLAGSDNDRDYTSYAHLDEHGAPRIWKKHQGTRSLLEATKVLLGDPQAAAQAYAEHSHNCSRCGRTLTVPASLHAGLGPECARKAGF